MSFSVSVPEFDFVWLDFDECSGVVVFDLCGPALVVVYAGLVSWDAVFGSRWENILCWADFHWYLLVCGVVWLFHSWFGVLNA